MGRVLETATVGSKTDAQYLVAEFVSKLGNGIHCLLKPLTVDTSILMAIGKDAPTYFRYANLAKAR